MQLTFEVTLDYGEDGPDEGETTPEADQIAQAVKDGLAAQGFTSADVSAQMLN